MLTENPAHEVLPCWLPSSILWDSIWKASDPTPYRCVHYLSGEGHKIVFFLRHPCACKRTFMLQYVVGNHPECLRDITSHKICTSSGIWLSLLISLPHSTGLNIKMWCCGKICSPADLKGLISHKETRLKRFLAEHLCVFLIQFCDEETCCDVPFNTSLESAHYCGALNNPIHVHVYFWIRTFQENSMDRI